MSPVVIVMDTYRCVPGRHVFPRLVLPTLSRLADSAFTAWGSKVQSFKVPSFKVRSFTALPFKALFVGIATL